MLETCGGEALTPEKVAELKRLCREGRKLIINTTAPAGCGHTRGSLSPWGYELRPEGLHS